MNNYRLLILRLSILLIACNTLAACGQKGPLEIERPPSVQEEELEEAI